MSDKLPLIVAYYTVNTPYAEEAKKLTASLEQLGLHHEVRGTPHLGSWEKNTHFKATFLQRIRAEYPERAILYVDSDSVFHSSPERLRGFSEDVAVRFQDFSNRKNECLSGTICLGPTEAVDELLCRWIELNAATPAQRGRWNTYEQVNLHRALEAMNGRIRLSVLPPEYCFIFDSMRRIYPTANPVIEHFQASRRLAPKRAT